jgi:predicted lipoprotein
MATCSSVLYPAAVIESVTKQMDEAKETSATDEIPLKLQLTPSMRASNIRDALVSPSFENKSIDWFVQCDYETD